MDHPARARVAEIVVARVGMGQTRASGYLVSPGWVLTACHVVLDAMSIGVWFGAPPELAAEACHSVDPRRVLAIGAADLALLPLGERADDSLCEPVLFGRLDRDPGPAVRAKAVGCPRFKLRPSASQPDVLLRELDEAIGSIAPLSDAKMGMYEFAVDVAPSPDTEPDTHSPWEGMSGAAVWASGRLIGVVGQHHPPEGPARLTVRPVEQLFGCATGAELEAWRTALPQLPSVAEGLWLATPPTARKIERARAMQAAEALAPRVIIGRGTELAELAEFTSSSERWRWVQGDAFAGKTALMAWFVLHPPERIDVASCFLRRASGENTADYALVVLTRQLALLADRDGYLPPPFVSERANDFADLLDEAARACAERRRRLLVLVDGLDEYDATTTSLDLASWLPDDRALPDQAMLLVASRAMADIQLPGHPLSSHVQPISTSGAATEIQAAAHAELDRALRVPGGLTFPLVCCLAIADGGLTANELRALLILRGRDADVGEIRAQLRSSLGRSLMHLPAPDLPSSPDANGAARVFVFAHDTLLAEARLQIDDDDLAAYEGLFDEWADEYLQQDWPPDTPRYLLRPYTRELAQRVRDPRTQSPRLKKSVDQLFKVIAHRSRLLRLFERTGNPAVPDEEIVAAQHTIIDTRDRSGLDADEVMFRLAVLALRRRPLAADRAGIAAGIATVWACIGHVDASFELAAGIQDPQYRVQALSDMAAALADAGQAGDALRAVTSIDDPEQRARALRKVAATLASTDQPAGVDTARQIMQAAASIDDPASWAEVLSGIAAILARASQAEAATDTARQALQAATSIRDAASRAEVLSGIASTLVNSGQPGNAADAARQARQAATSIHDTSSRAEALSKAAVALTETGQLGAAIATAAQAMQTATSIEDPASRAEVLSGIASTLVNSGQPGNAADAARQARQAATSIHDTSSRAEALSKAAVALAETGQLGAAADAAHQARPAVVGIPYSDALLGRLCQVAVVLAGAGHYESALQIAADVKWWWWRAAALSEIAATLAKAGQPGLAADAARQARQAAASIDDTSSRAEALSKAAVALAETGQPGAAADAAHQALQAAAGIDNRDPRSKEALIKIAVRFAETGQPESALQAANTIDDLKQQAQGLTMIAATLARVGQPGPAADAAHQALQTASRIANAEKRSQMLYGVAEALAAGGEIGPARQVVNGVDDPAGQAWGLSLVAAAFARADQPGAADHAALEVLQAVAGTNDPSQHRVLLTRMAAALAQAGQAGPALRAAASIDDPAGHVAAVISVAAELAGAGQLEAAAAAARQGLDAAASIGDPAAHVQALSWLSAALAGAGQMEAAAAAARQGLDAAASIGDPAAHVQALSWLSAALAGAGQLEAAAAAARQGLDAAASIGDPAAHVQALSWLSAALAGAGQLEAAAAAARQGLDAAASIGDPAAHVQALSWLSAALAGAGQMEAAAAAARQGLDAAASIGDPGQRTMALLETVVALAGASQLESALQAADKIDDPMGRSCALSGIAATQARVGQFGAAADIAQQALRAATSMNMEKEQATWALTYLAGVLARAGESSSALQAATSIENPDWRVWALSGVAAILAGVGQRRAAADAAQQAVQTAISIDDALQSTNIIRGLAAAVAGSTTPEAYYAANPAWLALQVDMNFNRPLYMLLNAWMAIRRGEALVRIGRSSSAADGVWQALQEGAGIDYLDEQTVGRVAPLRSSRMFSNGNSRITRRALELLLFAWDASDYLAVFPVTLLRRLIANGEFEVVKRNRNWSDG